MKRISMMIMMVLVMGLLFNGCGSAKDFDVPVAYTFHGMVINTYDENFIRVQFYWYDVKNYSGSVLESGDVNVRFKFFVKEEFVKGQDVCVCYITEKRIDPKIFRQLLFKYGARIEPYPQNLPRIALLVRSK
jgi:hypothetical protein